MLRKILLSFSLLLLTACFTPASDEALALDDFVMTDNGWRTAYNLNAEFRPLAVGETYDNIEDMVAAAGLYGTQIDVGVDQRMRKLTVIMTAMGYQDDSIAGERYVVNAVRSPAGDRVTAIEKQVKCWRTGHSAWVEGPCP